MRERRRKLDNNEEVGDKHTDTDMEVFRRRHSAVTRQKRDGTAKHLWDRCGCPFKRQTDVLPAVCRAIRPL